MVSVAALQRRLDLRRRREDEVAVDEVLVDVVGQHPDMRVPHQHVGQRLQFVARIGRAGRVRRRVQQHPFGARRDRALEILGLQLEAVLDPWSATITGLPPVSSTMSG